MSTDLPQPIVADSGQSTKKKTTFKTGLHVHWARFKKRIGTGSAPSESFLEGFDSTENSSVIKRWTEKQDQAGDESPDEVDVIVVENQFLNEGTRGSVSQTQPSEHGTPDKSGNTGSQMHTDQGSLGHGADSFWDRSRVIAFFRWHIVPVFARFSDLGFEDPAAERHYIKETWYTGKSLCLLASLYFVLNWVLGCINLPQKMQISDYVFYFGIAPVVTVPLPLMVIFDFPRDRPILWNFYLTTSVWVWGCYQVIVLSLCGYYGDYVKVFTCPGRDFLNIFFFTTALPTIAVFAMGQRRVFALSGALIFIGLICGLILPIKRAYFRSLINTIVFHLFLNYVQYVREYMERRIFKLRDELKSQYKAVQHAQNKERKAADSKRRLTSYIFHEVRIPLNTAMLASQNMAASTNIRTEQEIEFTALEGSLSMMSKVLNDVLDFNRMDAGRFESVSKPYAFHKVVQSMLVPLQLAAHAKELELEYDMDRNIDIVARKAHYTALGMSEDEITKKMTEDDEDGGMITGDEMRFRQIITNLTSNACKFTPAGGKVFVRTKLMWPPSGADIPSSDSTLRGDSTVSSGNTLSVGHVEQHNLHTLEKPRPVPPPSPQTLDHIVIRVEVSDTGVGIRKRDLVDLRLFSPYVQTESGRYQGGKGTGLGLALVRHIVKLSGGRLGLISKRHEGSTFWFELSVGVGSKVLRSSSSEGKRKTPMLPGLAADGTGFVINDRPGNTPRTGLERMSFNELAIEQIPSVIESATVGPTLASQSESALRTIMEQSGRKGIKRHDTSSTGALSSDICYPSSSNRTLATPDSSQVIKRTDFALAETSPDSSSHQSSPTSITPTSAKPNSIPNTSTTVRPSYLPMPSPRPFESPILHDGSSVGTSTTPSDLGLRRLKVLVVDDDPLTRKLMSRMLSRLGCIVETAENGQAALDLLLGSKSPASQTPTPSSIDPPLIDQSSSGSPSTPPQPAYFDVVFLDNQMPMMSGVEMTRKIRDMGRSDLIIGVTGNALKEDQIEYMEAGVDSVLTKPVLERSLQAMLSLAEDRRRQSPSQLPSPTHSMSPPPPS